MVYCYTSHEAREVLRELRLKKKLSQEMVGTSLSVSKGFISQIECGRRPIPGFRFLIQLLEIYEIKPKYFEELVSIKVKNAGKDRFEAKTTKSKNK